MIANLTGQQIRDRLDNDNETTVIVAKLVCSAYWDKKITLTKDLYDLDADGWALARAIMEYDRHPVKDAEFHALACWCRIRHSLKQWDGEE